MSGQLRCSICSKTFNNLPPDAIRIGQRAGAFQMYRFTDGTVHNLSSTKIGQNLKKAEKSAEEK